MNNKHQENGALRGPLIFNLPAFSFGVILTLDWPDGTRPGSCFRQNARLELSGNSAENGEGFRGRGVERKAGSWKELEPVLPYALLFGSGFLYRLLPRVSPVK
jgi:hypothetical protein